MDSWTETAHTGVSFFPGSSPSRPPPLSLQSAGLFGSARPREAVIANREGRTEEEVLRAEALERYRLQLRLSPQQAEEKRAATEALSTAQTLLSEAQDSENPPSAEALTALAADRDVAQAALDELMERFAQAALVTAQSGEAPRTRAMRREAEATQRLAAQQTGGGAQGGAQGGRQGERGEYGTVRYNPTQNYVAHREGGGAGAFADYGQERRTERAFGDYGQPRAGGERGFGDYGAVRANGRRGGFQGGRGGYEGGRTQGFGDYVAVPEGEGEAGRGHFGGGEGRRGSYGGEQGDNRGERGFYGGQGGRREGGRREESDAGFYDMPLGLDPTTLAPQQGGYGGRRGGRRRDGYGRGGGYGDMDGSIGMGGELKFEGATFEGQDRY